MKISEHLSDQAILRELGGRLGALRLSRNLTQATLAAEAGVSKRTIERLERGEVAARLSGLVRVCKALGLSDHLDTLVPSPAESPVDQLRLARRRRRRASGKRSPAAAKPARWTWGDES